MKWTEQACKADAKKYATRSEWSKESSSAYQAARRNGWLDSCCNHMGRVSLTVANYPPSTPIIHPTPTKTDDAVRRLKNLLKID